MLRATPLREEATRHGLHERSLSLMLVVPMVASALWLLQVTSSCGINHILSRLDLGEQRGQYLRFRSSGRSAVLIPLLGEWAAYGAQLRRAYCLILLDSGQGRL